MCPFLRPILTYVVVLTGLFSTSTAFGWVESMVTADAITVDIEPSGQAIVTHELSMRVRGGPLKGTELAGIDFDAEPLDEATVAPIGGGEQETKPLLLTRGDDDSLRIEVGDDKGLRNGSYVFRFRYKTHLRQKSRIDSRGAWAQIDWIGPRYVSGLDVAKVTFRLPFAPTAPRLPEVDPSADELALGQLPSAAMLSQLRRNGTTDELELLRPHVAKGEPVLWRIWTSPNVFPWLVAQKAASDSPHIASLRVQQSPWNKALPIIFAGILACAFSLLVWIKARAVTAEALRQGFRVIPLISLPANVRALGAGLGIAFSLLLSVRYELPTLGALTLVASLILTVYRAPRVERKLRGPGRWLPIHNDEAWRKPRQGSYGRWLDASNWRGRTTLLLTYVGLFALSSHYFPRQPYYALLAVMSSVALWPTMLTGTFALTPWAEEDRANLNLERFARKLARLPGAKLTVLGRFTDGTCEPDELRLRLSARSMLDGLLGLEITSNGGNVRVKPEVSLILRVREDSPAHARLGQTWTFGRGRTQAERVAIVTFAVAAPTRLIELLRDLLSASGPDQPARGQRPSLLNKVMRSTARGSVTSKPGKSASPSQATRAA